MLFTSRHGIEGLRCYGWRRPTEEVEPRCKNFEDGNRSKRVKKLIEMVTTPVVNADKIVLAAKGKQVKADMLHRDAEVRRWRRGDHRVGGLRWENTNTVRT